MNCEFCNKKFSNRGNLNYHQKTAKFCLALRDETNYKKYMCKFCETSFTRIDNLQTHQETCKQKISFEKDFVNSLNSELSELQAELQSLVSKGNYNELEADSLRTKISNKESEITNIG